MIKSILILGTDPCRSFELQDAILRARMNVETHVRQRSDDQDWNGADLILCSEDSPDLQMLLDFVEQRKPAARVVVLDEENRDSQYSLSQVRSLIEGPLPGKLFLAA
jgi:hypothetical protein